MNILIIFLISICWCKVHNREGKTMFKTPIDKKEVIYIININKNINTSPEINGKATRALKEMAEIN